MDRGLRDHVGLVVRPHRHRGLCSASPNPPGAAPGMAAQAPVSTLARVRYAELVAAGIIDHDPRQLVALAQMDAVIDGLTRRQDDGRRSRVAAGGASAGDPETDVPPHGGAATGCVGSTDPAVASGGPVCKGAYLYGGVGVGKSFLMDLMFEVAPVSAGSKKRIHFHEFMLLLHARLHEHRQTCAWGRGGDAIAHVAHELAGEAQLLCFDEFQVTDIADALILKPIFEVMFRAGVVMVATSNRPPGDLYEGGLNRTHFLPFIPLLEHHCAVVPISSDEDYRARTAPVAGRFITADSTAPAAAPSAAAQLEQQYLASTGGHRGSPLTLEISATRRIEVPRAYADVAFFRFEELCGAPVGSKTFAALCRRFRVIAVADIPQLSSKERDKARRFITLIDTMYECGTQLLASAAVPVNELFTPLEMTVVASEDQVIEPDAGYWPGSDSATASRVVVEGVGGERIEVSASEIAVIREVGFAFERTKSRLLEMQGADYAMRR